MNAAPPPAGEPSRWFPRTKLRPPVTGGDLLSRPRLLGQLRAAVLGHRLTPISAPAGAGKTTLVAALARELTDLPCAWLARDADDNDPATFIAALLAALRHGGSPVRAVWPTVCGERVRASMLL